LELFKLLHRLAKEQSMAVLVASHDLNLAASFADRLILLSQGRIVATGPAEQVLDPKILSQTYQIPIDRIDRPGKPPLVFPSFDR
jgi:iron complex transport system ATP-binding protein